MKYLKTYESFENIEEVRIYAWLYMLAYVYDNIGMSDKDWGHDDRMGITFSTAIKQLLKENLVVKKDDTWFPNEKSKDKLKSIFGSFTNRKDAENSGLEFKKYNTKDYHISTIPEDIYEREAYENIKKHNIELIFNNYDYDIISNWYKKYQRVIHGWNNKLNRYLGATNDLIKDQEYILYRGINIAYNETLKIGDYIEDNRISWTSSYYIAKKFAYGNEHYMDNKNKIDSGRMGLILEQEFKYYDVLLDTELINEIHPYLKGVVDFPNEFEVIVAPKRRKVKIIEIIK